MSEENRAPSRQLVEVDDVHRLVESTSHGEKICDHNYLIVQGHRAKLTEG